MSLGFYVGKTLNAILLFFFEISYICKICFEHIQPLPLDPLHSSPQTLNFMTPHFTFFKKNYQSIMCSIHVKYVEPSSGTYLIYQASHPQRKLAVPLPRAIKYQLLLSEWQKLENLYLIHAGTLTGQVLCRSCVGNHSCYKFMSSVVLLHRRHWFSSVFFNLSLLQSF